MLLILMQPYVSPSAGQSCVALMKRINMHGEVGRISTKLGILGKLLNLLDIITHMLNILQ